MDGGLTPLWSELPLLPGVALSHTWVPRGHLCLGVMQASPPLHPKLNYVSPQNPGFWSVPPQGSPPPHACSLAPPHPAAPPQSSDSFHLKMALQFVPPWVLALDPVLSGGRHAPLCPRSVFICHLSLEVTPQTSPSAVAQAE